GGYVTWTRRAFGPFWAFQVGWWSWVDSFVDVAVYPALFVEYARFWYPAMTPLERWLLVVVFVTVLTALNVIGVRPTGRAAVALALASGAIEWSAWTTGILPVVARRMGGDWLGHAVAAGAVVGTAGLFMSLLLTNSRLPYVLARDRAMPAWLGAVHRRFGTPW